MKQEERELLLKDLCARLPYGVKVWYKYSPDKYLTGLEIPSMKVLVGHKFDKVEHTESIVEAGEILIKPYLRPMSSMTEEEKEEYNTFFTYDGIDDSCFLDYIDWLHSHHFDYRGLIEKGLALEATHEIYPELIEKPITIPNNLEEAVNSLNEILSKEDKEYVLKEGALAVHHSLGRWIRNNWGLWEEEPNELKKSLIDKGFSHPDDMSNYIIEEYIRKNTTES